jgi:hypothetical protein
VRGNLGFPVLFRKKNYKKLKKITTKSQQDGVVGENWVSLQKNNKKLKKIDFY